MVRYWWAYSKNSITRSGKSTNSRPRAAISVKRLRVSPSGSHFPSGSLPRTGGTARGPNDGLFASNSFRPRGVSRSSASRVMFVAPRTRIQTPVRSRGFSVPLAGAHPLGRCQSFVQGIAACSPAFGAGGDAPRRPCADTMAVAASASAIAITNHCAVSRRAIGRFTAHPRPAAADRGGRTSR
jgi:hypothetical protein